MDDIKENIAALRQIFESLKRPNTHVTKQTTVSSTPKKIPDVALADRKFMHVQNDTGSVIRIGGPDVGLNKGIELKNNEMREYKIGPGIELYAWKQSGSGVVTTHEFA